MIAAVVSLNGEDFEVTVPGDVYDAERLDYNLAVERALEAHRLAHPLDRLETATLEVTVYRLFSEVATHDGEGVDTNDSQAAFNAHARSGAQLDEDELPDDEDDNLPEPGDSDSRQEHDERLFAEDLSDEELDAMTAPDDEGEHQSFDPEDTERPEADAAKFEESDEDDSDEDEDEEAK